MVINPQLEHRLMIIHENRLQLTEHTDFMLRKAIMFRKGFPLNMFIIKAILSETISRIDIIIDELAIVLRSHACPDVQCVVHVVLSAIALCKTIIAGINTNSSVSPVISGIHTGLCQKIIIRRPSGVRLLHPQVHVLLRRIRHICSAVFSDIRPVTGIYIHLESFPQERRPDKIR